jgi:hypothetical protein
MIKELAALRSATEKRTVAADHHSSRTASSDGRMSGSSSLVITPTQMARVNGQRNKR